MKNKLLRILFLLSALCPLLSADPAFALRGLFISNSATCADVKSPEANFTYCLPAQGANKNQLLVWNGSAFVAAISGTGSAYATVQDEGTPLTQRSTLNLTGAGVTCTDNAGNASTDCDIPGGGGGGSSAFNDITGGTNTTAAMVVGTGASLSTAGSGTIAATTSAALAANGSNCAVGQAAAGVDASGAAEGCTDYAEEPAASGLIAKTAANTTAARTITGTTNQITVTNGSGVSGNPTLSIPTSPTLPGTTTGTFSGNLTGNVTGNASTASALAANGANCTAGNAPLGVDASGAAEGCFDVATQAELNTHAGLTGSSAHGATSANTASQIVTRDASGNFSAGTVTAALSGNASTATALAANGTNCGLGEAAQGIDASGNAEGCFTPAGGGGGANIVLDLGDDGANESTTLSEIATSGDTNSIFTEPSADKLLIDLSKKWPAADTATTASALASNPADCSSNQYATTIAANGDLTCAQPASTQLSDTSDLVRNNAGNTYSTGAQDFGSATSLKVPTAAGASPTASGNIAYDSTSNTLEAGVNGANKTVAFTDSNISGNAGTATALAANGANCSAGQAPLGVDASGAAEGCFDVATQTELDNHINDTTAAHAASAIANTPAGNIAATDVQAAINELDTEKQPAGSYLTGVTADSPLSGSGTSGSHLVIADAAADGSTKGSASFTANDFDATAGNISLDYTNGQKSSATVPGFLSSTDWSTFNSKVGTSRAISTTSPLSGGGDLSADRTIACATCTTNASALTANLPMIGGGSNAAAVGTRSGNTTKFVTMDASTPATNDCAKWDASGNLTTAGAACGSGGSSTVYFIEPGLRLTLTTGVPVTTSDVTAAGTLYYTPFKSCRIVSVVSSALANACITEISLSLTLTSGKNYDVFVSCTNSTTCALALSSAWTDDTTRADALATETLCGCTVLSSDHTKLWIGTIRASGTNTTEDSTLKRFVWNSFNRVSRQLLRITSTASWTYATNTWRQANADTANQVEAIVGLSGASVVSLSLNTQSNNSATADYEVAIGIDSTSSPSTDGIYGYTANLTSGGEGKASYAAPMLLGYHKYTWLERAMAGVSVTVNGTYIRTGIVGTVEN